MKTTVTRCDFQDAFQKIRPENFSYQGLNALFEYLEEYEEDTGQEIELDVIAICCDFSEYENLAAFQENYGEEYETIEDIEQETVVIRFGVESFIIQDF